MPTATANTNSTPSATQPDATADFFATLQDPRRWVIKPGVPVFKPHQRTDPATGKLISVDVPKLYRIAENMQRMERQGGVPIRMTLGHTEPGKPEVQQPPVGGYYRNARVATFGPNNEPAIVVDEWLDPQYTSVRKNFPYRSSEYYDDTEQITGVALLTRDPFLDLGVVAYSRGDAMVAYVKDQPNLVHYGSNGTAHYGYRMVMGDSADTLAVALPPARTAQPTSYSGPWPGPAYHPHPLPPHQHTSTGAVYADACYDLAGNPISMPPAAGGRPAQQGPSRQPTPPGGGGPERFSRNSYGGNRMNGRGRPGRYADEMGAAAGMSADPLQVLAASLQAAMEAVTQMMQGGASGPGGPPPGPFPEGGGGGAGEAPYSRSAARPQAPQRPYSRAPQQPRGGYGRYERAAEPTAYNAPAAPAQRPQAPAQPPLTTISGQPVGYQMKLEQLQYEKDNLEKAVKVLYYERDQADTQACVAEIQRLAAAGFPVSEYEIGELKGKKTPADRAAYIEHITTRYARVPVDVPPVMPGDPTPGPADNAANRPATREEMEQALKMTEGSSDPNAFTNAIQYIRSGARTPVAYGVPGAPVFAGTQFPPTGAPVAVPQGDPAMDPATIGFMNQFADPYGNA